MPAGWVDDDHGSAGLSRAKLLIDRGPADDHRRGLGELSGRLQARRM
jgi:hypothetical protein